MELLREQSLKKVDHDYLQVAASKIKAECQALIATYQTEQGVVRKQRDEKVEERLSRVEAVSERTHDEGALLRDQLRSLQEERKRDVEETAEFIKQIITAGKQEWQREVARVD